MVEVIWPLSVAPCNNQRVSGRSVLPLRTYIEETLRRSRTSYSTLQVALYYLVLIKPFVPRSDFTMEQTTDCPASHALMCGRRMFLAALILASKYLQDRNYSAKAWSKMSGLKVDEINTNERTFLNKICWKLHIAEPVFKRWTDVVLRYTPSLHPPSPGQGMGITWKSLIPVLTPELDKVPLSPQSKPEPASRCPASYGCASPTTPTTPTPPRSVPNPMQLASTSQQTTPTPHNLLPRFLEPKPDLAPPTPALARMGPLPTPNMTPSSVASNTPAATCRNVPRLRGFPQPVKEEKVGIEIKPTVLGDDTEMVSTSPDTIDFAISDKALHAPHRHSKHAPQPSGHAPATDKSRKRARPRGGRRSDLQEEVRMLLEEELDAMDVDYNDHEDEVSPSPAATYASSMLSGSTSVVNSSKEAQAPPSLSRQTSRVPVLKNEGKKRTCCAAASSSSSSSMSISPSPLWGEVV
ncbi:hypothetical protein B0A50_04434 [Salinomyces thailandicus]|uniref:G1/S-specific cyclin pas1 n=1 Tax=Salinomyces thailandicus TaxID=706561 RepID=A0A4U0TZP9_9PEZI|nr:hypothetical protein B0A50_04434 [Salinomyces thailandica]